MILDVRMPRLNGHQVCEKLKSQPATQGIHIIILTAYGQPHDHLLSLACGADDFLVKPFSPRELSAKIRKVLGPSSAGEPA
jgi:DNA-binding response OmpR family regulator